MGDPFSMILMVGGLVMSIMQANAMAQAQNEQIKQEIQVENVKAASETADRFETMARQEASNRVANAVQMGGGVNLSYERGIQPYNYKVASRDVANIEFNRSNTITRLKHNIKVNNMKKNFSIMGSIFDTVGGIAGGMGGSVGGSRTSSMIA